MVIHLLFDEATTNDWLLEVILGLACARQLTGVVGIIKVHVLLIFVLNFAIGAHVSELLLGRRLFDCSWIH